LRIHYEPLTINREQKIHISQLISNFLVWNHRGENTYFYIIRFVLNLYHSADHCDRCLKRPQADPGALLVFPMESLPDGTPSLPGAFDPKTVSTRKRIRSATPFVATRQSALLAAPPG